MLTGILYQLFCSIRTIQDVIAGSDSNYEGGDEHVIELVGLLGMLEKRIGTHACLLLLIVLVFLINMPKVLTWPSEVFKGKAV